MAEINTVKAYSGTYTGEILTNGTVAYRGVRFASCKRWERPVVMPSGNEDIKAQEYGPASDEGDSECLNCVIYVNPEKGNRGKKSDWEKSDREKSDREKSDREKSDQEKTNREKAVWEDTVTNRKLPGKSVFVWQYGSAQIGGSNSYYTFENFVKANPDIIVVCPNHRGNFWGSVDLSMLEGYQTVKDIYEASNNLTRLDELACLRWIHENIAAFGGNPDDVTIGGHSSGSNNMTCLLLMKEAHPYFNKAICQASFSCDISLQTLETARFVSADLWKRLGVKTVQEALDIPIEEINRVRKEIQANSASGASAYGNIENKLFSPVIDGVVIPEDYYERLLDGSLKGKTLVFGNNSGEYDQQYAAWEKNEGDNWKKALDFTISQNWGKLSSRGWNAADAPKVIEEYFSHNEEYHRNDWTAAKDLKNDLFLRSGSIIYADAISRYTDVYMYFLDWTIRQGARAAHGSENTIIARKWEDVPENMTGMAEMISDVWASFIRTGNPGSSLLPEKWTKYDPLSRNTMYISENSHMAEGVRKKDMEILLPLLREYPLLKAALEQE